MSHERLAGANVELPSSSLLCNANKMIISREHIDSLRAKFESLPNKTPDNQEILLELEDNQQQPKEPSSTNGGAGGELVVEVAQLVIKSGAKNALSGRMMSQLTERLDQLESWAMANNSSNTGEGRRLARCLLIRGHGGTFCSGSDLITARHTTTNQLAGWELAQLMQYNLRRLAQLPLISVAFIEGYALGGGAELALAADMRLMSGEARLGFVHAKNGICCGWSGGFRLVQLAGRARALELMSSARLIGHQEAQQFGLCEQRADSLDEALKFVRGHAIESERTSAAVKLLVEETSSGSSSAELALQLECKLFAATWGKEAHLRALDRNSKHHSSSSSK